MCPLVRLQYCASMTEQAAVCILLMYTLYYDLLLNIKVAQGF